MYSVPSTRCKHPIYSFSVGREWCDSLYLLENWPRAYVREMMEWRARAREENSRWPGRLSRADIICSLLLSSTWRWDEKELRGLGGGGERKLLPVTADDEQSRKKKLQQFPENNYPFKQIIFWKSFFFNDTLLFATVVVRIIFYLLSITVFCVDANILPPQGRD